ncbi:MAG TPA: YndJ family transporter [Polyangiaceae bacterium]|nr:YndJ family transporter [Polyangiaceae bacterium]
MTPPWAIALDPLNALARALVAIGPLAVVPLGLAITPGAPRPLALAAPPAAVLFAAALALPAGPLAAALTTPWVAVTLAVGLTAAARFARRPSKLDPAELVADVGFAYLPVGGAWAMIHRADLGAFGFSGTAALLTAAHFHFAGFGLCVLLGALLRALGPRRDALDLGAAALGAGTVGLVAVGILTSRAVERAFASVLVAAVALAARSLVRVGRAEGGAPRLLCWASAASGVFAAAFAAHFAASGFAELGEPALRRMLVWHATPNALGFIGAGLLGRWLRGR